MIYVAFGMFTWATIEHVICVETHFGRSKIEFAKLAEFTNFHFRIGREMKKKSGGGGKRKYCRSTFQKGYLRDEGITS